ncbi:hypothetical protein PPERSA_02616 [Pseudocohnilembus persalinus]|uniref:Uncharacterized protein n=1 Tax=Pseudocohnilembus persalinus TaxID=266149 RepID=A0A0V0R5V8_PSEPJ|nr:hypothetical protein PPERSA_02616 [Pseudocohnilembus persalinus]|eukprot:KRX09744.1 hypothetical protein PPERSA_02616 [Pseudocohnilembus persalinus]
MYRQIPVSNKLCFQKNFERDMEIHRQKISNVKPSIDQGKPKQLKFLKTKKPSAYHMGRETEIRNENAILLNKIVNIMSDYKKPNMIRSQTQSQIHHQPGSLNKEIRKRNLVNIVIENEAIGKRISEKKSNYNVQKWKQERKQIEKYITNKCEYQYKNYQPTQTQVKFGIWDHNQSKSVSNKTSKNFRLAPITHKQQPRKIFNTIRRIGLDKYFIEVKVAKGVFLIQLENVEKANQSYKIELLEKEGLKIWNQECQQKPDLLLERIRVDERSKSVFFKRLNDNVSVLQDSRVADNQSFQFKNQMQNNSKNQLYDNETLSQNRSQVGQNQSKHSINSPLQQNQGHLEKQEEKNQSQQKQQDEAKSIQKSNCSEQKLEQKKEEEIQQLENKQSQEELAHKNPENIQNDIDNQLQKQQENEEQPNIQEKNDDVKQIKKNSEKVQLQQEISENQQAQQKQPQNIDENQYQKENDNNDSIDKFNNNNDDRQIQENQVTEKIGETDNIQKNDENQEENIQKNE